MIRSSKYGKFVHVFSTEYMTKEEIEANENTLN